MVTSFIRHKVENYESWKKIYDEFSSVKKENGVIGAGVFQQPDDSNTIIITHDFENMEVATKFLSSEELKKAMKNAGVIGEPEIWFGEVQEKTPY